ncbi:MAG: helix-turn-helix transcriptional regulator [Aeriscardovia sp.]|jgi:DNA-binding Xre family transcriptional regulator|nr:helix-turn-helix transcriptional regulator [Aeriscardovia sp.]
MTKNGSFLGMCAAFCWKFYKFAANINNLLPMAKDINRIKVVLVEQKRTGKWLAEQMGKDQATVSKWCTNTSQPDLPTLTKVAEILNVDIKELLNSTKS